MIRFVEGEVLEQRFFALCAGSAFGCKLEALARAYGFQQPFARFWAGERAAYCLLDGVLAVAGEPEEESGGFAAALGPAEIFCPQSFAGAFALERQEGGPALVRQGEGAGAEWRGPVPTWRELEKMHGLLGSAGLAGDFQAFYLDISHRMRHGAAYGAVRYQEGRLVGCGLVSAVTEEAALLSALAVEAGFRGRGLGSGIVEEICRVMGDRSVYVLRADGQNEGFYERMGFYPCGRWLSGPLKH